MRQNKPYKGLKYALSIAVLILFVTSPAFSKSITTQDQKHFETVQTKIKAGHHKQALTQSEKIKNKLLKRIAHWFILSHAPKSLSTFAHYDRFLNAPQTWPRRVALQKQAELLIPKQWTASKVIAWFDEKRPQTLQGTDRLARALRERGQPQKAIKLIQSSWRRGLGGTEKKFFKSYGALLTEDDHIARLNRSLRLHRYSAAQRLLTKIPPDLRALAKARLALIRKKKGVDSLIAAVPDSLKDDPRLVHDRAKWRLDKGRPDSAASLLVTLAPPQNQDNRFGWQLKRQAARDQLSKGEIETAYKLAAGHGLKRGTGFAEGEFLAGWIALRRLRQPARAYQHFFTLYKGVTSGISKARAAYWAARAALALDKSDWAIRWFTLAAHHPTTFYGQKAAFLLGSKPPVLDFSKPELTAEARTTFATREITQIIEILNWANVEALQNRFLAHLRRTARTRDDFIFAADLAQQNKQTHLVIRAAKAARKAGYLLPAYLYPTPALRHKPQALIQATMRQESEMNAKAKSPMGARGLMQIRPQTARQIAKSEKLPYSQAKLTTDPAYNVQLGQAYLKKLIVRFDGVHALALAGYNAGPGRVKQWIKSIGSPSHSTEDVSQAYRQLPPTTQQELSPDELARQFQLLDWIEQIPFAETRNYIQRVLEARTVYAAPRTKIAPRSPLY